MKTKENVTIDKLDKKLKEKLMFIEWICKTIEGEKYEITITSANDGKHMTNSLHYKNKAVDLRTRDMKNAKVCGWKIKQYLGKDFDVILEKDHLHIEYEPKKKKGGKIE